MTGFVVQGHIYFSDIFDEYKVQKNIYLKQKSFETLWMSLLSHVGNLLCPC